MTNKEKYISLLASVPNTDGLVEWLCKTDFFTAPASTKYHNSFEGGLVAHSLAVLSELRASKNAKLFTDESIIKVALLHDICKANFYAVDYRNAKIDGKWEQVPYYTVKDDFPYGHGEKSVLLASRFIDLTEEEIMAIRWHMGGFDDSARAGNYSIGEAFKLYPLAVMAHLADLEATYLLEKGTSTVNK